jgi:autotransporter adhesin
MSNDLGRPEAAKEDNRDFKISNWTDIADSAQTISASGDHAYQVENSGYRWVRLVWTQTSGSGTITSARFNCKGV